MNVQLLLSILSSSFVAGVAGAYVGHLLTSRRERKNRLQQQRIQYLVEAYRAFAKAVHHPRLYEVADELELAVADVQLLGSPQLIELTQKFCRKMAADQVADLDDILEAIRRDLRAELGELPVSGRMMWFRISGPSKNSRE
jgi:hypothetical protein